jgi:DNA-directed RNA polymerase subunit RPC12/RpoP
VFEMPKVRVRIDESQADERTKMVACPSCGRKLVDVQSSSGASILRIKCTRCGKYVKVNIT